MVVPHHVAWPVPNTSARLKWGLCEEKSTMWANTHSAADWSLCWKLTQSLESFLQASQISSRWEFSRHLSGTWLDTEHRCKEPFSSPWASPVPYHNNPSCTSSMQSLSAAPGLGCLHAIAQCSTGHLVGRKQNVQLQRWKKATDIGRNPSTVPFVSYEGSS